MCCFLASSPICIAKSASNKAKRFSPGALATDIAIVLQERSIAAGATTTYISPSSIRINFGRESVFLIANAPRWDVVLYNNTSKKGLKMTYVKWVKHSPRYAYAFDDDWLRTATLLRVKDTRILGLLCHQYVLTATTTSGRIVPKNFGITGTLAMAEVQAAPEAACRILSTALSMPSAAGIPVQFEASRPVESVGAFRENLGGKSFVLKTISVKKNVCPRAFFAYPATFTPVNIEADVILDAEHTKQTEQIFDLVK
jgi:hypothetical protein